MNIALIIIGYLLWNVAARGFFASGGDQELGTGIVTLISQISGIGLIIWGLAGFF